MHSPLLIACTVLATLGKIEALPSSPKYIATTRVAKFEDAGFTPLNAVTPVNVYQDIFYNGFSGVNNAAGFITGVQPQSPNNQIGYGMADVSTTQQGDPEMSAVYQNSNVTFFDLTSFFYGCSAADVLPMGCKITATCVDPEGQVVASDVFDFDGNGGVVQQMREARPKGFVGCQSVKFLTTGQVTGSTATIITLLDTISYIVYKLIA